MIIIRLDLEWKSKVINNWVWGLGLGAWGLGLENCKVLGVR